jgi:hypothetical protein
MTKNESMAIILQEKSKVESVYNRFVFIPESTAATNFADLSSNETSAVIIQNTKCLRKTRFSEI